MTRAFRLLVIFLGANVLGACTGSVDASSTGTGGTGGTGGNGGTAGSGAMRGYRPPDSQLSGCTTACEREGPAMCPAEATLTQCIAAVNDHVREEESQIFPRLQEHLDADARAEMCRGMEAMVDTTPTRP